MTEASLLGQQSLADSVVHSQPGSWRCSLGHVWVEGARMGGRSRASSPSKRKAAPPPKMEELDLAAAGAGEESARTAGEGKKKQKRSTRSQRK